MHPLFNKWKSATEVLSNIEQDIIEAGKLQFTVESRAFFDVFGKETDRFDANIYGIKISYYTVSESGVVQAWRYGSYGGEDYVVWERSLLNKSDDELYTHFAEQFFRLEESEKKEKLNIKDAKRAQLLAELAKLDE